jgi:hypothetical protein
MHSHRVPHAVIDQDMETRPSTKTRLETMIIDRQWHRVQTLSITNVITWRFEPILLCFAPT